jgi:serine/threonine protein kinase/formylglycine-generating enzyme required for sulfatase activity
MVRRFRPLPPMTSGDPLRKAAGKPAKGAQPQSPARPKPPASPPRELRPPSGDERIAISGYHLLQIIGRGSTGAVYRAIQLSMQREVALKVLSPDFARQPGFSERFVREARAAGAVHHPNVVTCYDVGEVGGVVYQALELMSGSDLEQYLASRGGRLPFKDALGILIECARGLEGIHRAGLAHCDIAPANIFITQEETVKLSDLGLARSLAGDEAHAPVSAPAALATLAPEQLGVGEAPDIRVDTYALGATLFIATTGRPPFDAPSRDELERQILDAPVPDPRDFDPTLPAGLAAVIAKAMAKDRQARYATPVQLREDLERLQFDFAPMHAVLPESRRYSNPANAHVPGTKTVYGHIANLNEPTPPEHHDAVAASAAPASGRSPLWAWMLGGSLVCLALMFLAVVAGWWWRGPRALAATDAVPLTAALLPPAAGVEAAKPEIAWQKPAWASRHGEDAHGRWAEVAVANASQRLRFCPAGTFLMGSAPSDSGHRDDEAPVRITLRHGFWLGDTPVSQRLYEAVVGQNPSAFTGAELPVESVSWEDAQRFLQHINALLPSAALRLPTEAEWEYAARAGSADVPLPPGRIPSSGRKQTHAVGSDPGNAWGLHDLLGNVLEWCQDFYMPYPVEAAVDPIGWQGITRVARGGAWSMGDGELRLATRTQYLPVTRFFFLGLRIAASEP